MKHRILCVDDEIPILALLQAQLGKQYEVIPAQGGEQGLAAIATQGPFSVIVSDMHMPAMSGIEFLAQARVQAPDSVRMLFTGRAEIETAIAAVNDGNIFRFLTKPCPVSTFVRVIQAGVDQHLLLTAEKELLEKTLHGSIKVLADVLGAVNPLAFGRASRVQQLVKQLTAAMGIANAWQHETAALLSQIGCVTMPEAVLAKVYAKESLTEKEQAMVLANSRLSHELLAHIPRLETIVESIACRDHCFNGAGMPAHAKKGLDLPLGSRLLKVALDLDTLETHEPSRAKAVQRMKERAGWYDPAILAVLQDLPEGDSRFTMQSVVLADLRPEMILAGDVRTTTGRILVRKGQEITSALIQRLFSFAASTNIEEPIKVQVQGGQRYSPPPAAGKRVGA